MNFVKVSTRSPTDDVIEYPEMVMARTKKKVFGQILEIRG